MNGIEYTGGESALTRPLAGGKRALACGDARATAAYVVLTSSPGGIFGHPRLGAGAQTLTGGGAEGFREWKARARRHLKAAGCDAALSFTESGEVRVELQ